MSENTQKILSNRLTYGMVGGGSGSFIGPVHKAAIAIDHSADLVCGSFSHNKEKNQVTGLDYQIISDRIYDDFEQMAEAEGNRSDGIDFVVIVVPNNLHYQCSKVFLEQGINVVCDKPLAFTPEEGYELMHLATKKGLEFMVTYTYTGYPMVNEAKNIIADGKIGDIRMVMAEYLQGWLADRVEDTDNKQAQWRVDPERAGLSCCVGDIGTHVENMIHYVTGLEIDRLSASLDSFVEGRKLDDNARINIEYKGGAKGIYWASQIAISEENGLKFRIYGTKGALEWEQEKPNVLIFKSKDLPTQVYTRGNGYLSTTAQQLTRIPAGHPEGYFEAFGNLYKNYCKKLSAKKIGEEIAENVFFTDVTDGTRGIKFVHDCVKSSNQDGVWVDGSFDYKKQ
ncbi:MAG TPA: Gfo/Idh/MocA family oxidoreductase [Thermotogota bacterium]|nr:Gfo/Idh/MocA family oxidoreductase [Thermotogota bacterium]HRW34715.1 Gfo/Idh/MocA family oxidoreductase [Thermotogota bacterium]